MRELTKREKLQNAIDVIEALMQMAADCIDYGILSEYDAVSEDGKQSIEDLYELMEDEDYA